MKILIADDDNVSGILLKKFLEICGHNVIYWARDGEELVKSFKENIDNVELVITDIMMPETNGLEAAREIKKIKKDIVIVAVTCVEHGTYLTDKNGKYIPWTSCDLFLRKPIDTQSIRNIIQVVKEIHNGKDNSWKKKD
jgi:CheY-like chemotaxis protein